MANSLATWAICMVLACWVIVIAHQLGWSLIDPQRYDFWRATLYLAYPTIFVSTGALVVAILLALVQRK